MDIKDYTSSRVFVGVRELDERQSARHSQRRRAAMARMDAAKMIEAAKSPNGGWTKETLAGWGVPWPPPKGWKRDLIERLKKGA
jgi:hypothetical protein